jgi:hypothetical protein
VVGAAAAVALVLGLGFAAGMAINAARAVSATTTPGPQRRHSDERGPSFGHGGPGRGVAGLTVISVNGQTITAKRQNGSTVTIHVSSTTQYLRAGQKVTLSAVTAGESILVYGARASDGSINAVSVMIVLPVFRGQVTEVNGSTITIASGQGTATVDVTGATVYVTDSGAASSLSAVVKGAEIMAVGTKNSDGSLAAEQIIIVTPRLAGKVSAVTGTTITLAGARGTQIIHVTTITRYVTYTMSANGPTQSPSSLSAVKAGVFIVAEGTRNGDGSLTATTIVISSGSSDGSWRGWPASPGPSQGD